MWFGTESAIVDYVSDVRAMQTWVAYDGDAAIGFASINLHFATAAEIHVMGILEKYHRRGIGHQLISVIEKDLRPRGVQFLTVKTISDAKSDEGYDITRQFYLSVGFSRLEEFKNLWGAHNSCLLLIKKIS